MACHQKPTPGRRRRRAAGRLGAGEPTPAAWPHAGPASRPPAGRPGTLEHCAVDTDSLEVNEVPGAPLTAVLVHPHPDMGGDRFNHLIDALYRGLPAAGVSAARFDLTSSDPDRAAADTVEAIAAVGPARVVLVGYSFGGDIALGAGDDRVAGWAAVAPPLRFGRFHAAGGDPRPKLLVVPERDQFTPPGEARQRSAGWTSTDLVVIDGADHFLNGAAAAVVQAVLTWLAGRPWTGAVGA